jgi:hypothetical protein
MEGGCLWWLIAPSNESSCVQYILVDGNKATEGQPIMKLVQIMEYLVCDDHFIYRHLRKPAI